MEQVPQQWLSDLEAGEADVEAGRVVPAQPLVDELLELARQLEARLAERERHASV